jgi:hypothetical protein
LPPHPASALHARSSRSVAVITRRRETICMGPPTVLRLHKQAWGCRTLWEIVAGVKASSCSFIVEFPLRTNWGCVRLLSQRCSGC